MSVYNIVGDILREIARKNGIEALNAYDVNGTQVYKKVDYDTYTTSNYCNVSLSPMQGFDIFNGIIFQYLANNINLSDRMATVNVGNSSIINSNISCLSGHGDSASFTHEYYDQSDEFPLILVSADTNPTKIYLNRVTRSSSETIKTYYFPDISQTGYNSGHCYDEDNKELYILGYKEHMWDDDDGGKNTVIVSKWDMSQITDNGDGTYTPRFISSYERPFIMVMQGQQWRDGMIWISSAHYEGAEVGYTGNIFALDPKNGELLHTIPMNNSTKEIEGISFLSDTEMVYGLQGGEYKKITFEYSSE